jgi:small subunit ribosomal protein S5
MIEKEKTKQKQAEKIKEENIQEKQTEDKKSSETPKKIKKTQAKDSKEITETMIEQKEVKEEKQKEKEFEQQQKEKKSKKEMTREERAKEEIKERIASWIPKTKIGKLVKGKKLTDLDEILEKYKILEPEIVDSLLDLDSELLAMGQAKGKFGGGKRRAWRQTQKKTAEGNVPSFSASVVVGNKKGYVGLGFGKAKETLPARSKAIRHAKLNIFKVVRGCGSFDCICNEKHSIPFKVQGKNSSSSIILLPAPQGTGLVAGDEIKKILRLAGIKDVYSKTFGKTKTTANLAKATIDALKKLKEKSYEEESKK